MTTQAPVFQDPDLASPKASQMMQVAPGIGRITGFFPDQVQAIQTMRQGGVSRAPYDQLNFGHHVGDDPQAVQRNRDYLRQTVDADLVWLDQVHGSRVVAHPTASVGLADCRADAIFANERGRACLVMTADCLPILIARPDQQQAAAVHAGWRGLSDGVIEAALDRLVQDAPCTEGPDEWWIWLGPAIGPAAFEVGDEVRATFIARDSASAAAFMPKQDRPGKWLADLGLLARLRLQSWFTDFRSRRSVAQPLAGPVVLHVAQQNDCVFSMPERYFSYRRDHVTGRMASLISLI